MLSLPAELIEYILEFTPISAYLLVCKDLHLFYLKARERSSKFDLKRLSNSPFVRYYFTNLISKQQDELLFHSLTSSIYYLDMYQTKTLIHYLFFLLKNNIKVAEYHVIESELEKRRFGATILNFIDKMNRFTANLENKEPILLSLHQEYYKVERYYYMVNLVRSGHRKQLLFSGYILEENLMVEIEKSTCIMY